jgi:hypothetical protein
VHSNPDARERHAVRLGVAGAVLAFLALTTVQAVAIRPYLPPDELYHVGYAATVLDGRLPTLTTPLPTDRVPLAPDDGRPRRVYVANHPPLFYALTALPLGLGEWFEAPRAGFLAARLLSASLAAVGLVMVAVLALTLVPGRPRVAVGVVWLVALLPSLPHVSAFVYNDGLGFLAATATLAAAVVVVRRGWGAAPRTSGAGPAGPVRDRGRSRRRGNRRRRGDRVLPARPVPVRLPHRRRLQPGAVPLQALGQHPRPVGVAGLRAAAVRRPVGLDPLQPARVPTPAALVAVPGVVGVLVLAGLALAAVGRLRAHPPARPGAPVVAAWGLALVWLAGVYAMVVSYDGNGGHLHPRYLFPGLAVLAVIGAVGLDRLAGGRRGLWVLGLAATQLALTAAAWAGFVTALRGRRPDGPADLAGALAGLLDAAGVSWPWLLLVVAGMLVLGALGLLGLALAWTAPRRPAPRPATVTTLESSHAS